MAFGEAFTVLAVLKATDEISKVLDKIDEGLDRFSSTAQRAAGTASESGARIDEGLLETASGADALELAAARTATAQEKLAAATKAQADAESALLEARAAVASEDELAAAAETVAAAQQKATAAATELKDAQTALAAATKAKASEEDLAKATAAVTAAEEKATAATRELTEAREQQAALVTPQDIQKAADDLTAAEKRATAATTEASAAQQHQADVERAGVLATEEGRAAADEAAAAQERLAEKQKLAAAGSAALSSAMKWGALGVAAVGYESIKAAGNFQSLSEHLVTDGGESQKSLAAVQAGMLQLAAATGTSTTDIANGMYHVESAGYHLKQGGLDVLKAAAEGAKVGGADLDTVSKALTGTMNAFNMSGSQATSMMNQLIATVSQGDMRMQDLASSLGNVAPIAASAGISFAQVGAAIATMTAQNMSAQQATQDLSHTISSLQNPNAVQIKEMQALGLNANEVSKNLGKVGLTGTLDQLTQAVAANTKGGDVLISTFNSSKQAAANAETMIKAMPGSLQNLAKAYLDGSVSTKQWTTDLKGLPPIQASMMKQFAGVADQTHKFNSLLTSGSPAAQTYNAAMSKLLGGTTGLKTALMLTGGRMGTFKAGVDAISASAAKGGKDVDNWGTIQQTFNQKMDRLKSSVEAAGVGIGNVLLPVVSKIAGVVAGVVGPMAQWISQHQKWVGLAVAVAGAIGAVVAAMKAWEIVQGVMNALMAIFDAETETFLSPISLVVIAIAALVAGLIYAYTHFRAFRDVVNDVGRFVKDVFVGLWHALETAFHAIVSAAEATWHGLQAAWNAVVGAAKTVWSTITGIWNAIVNVTTTVWDGIKGFFEKWWPLLLVIFAPPIALIMAIWNHFHTQIEDTAKTVWNGIKSFFVGIWDFLKTAAAAAFNLVYEYVITPMERAWHMVVSVWDSIKGAFGTALNWIKGIVQRGLDLVYQYIDEPLARAYQFVARIFSQIVSTITGAINGVLSWLGGVGSWFVSIGSDIVNGIIHGIESAGSALFSTLGNLAKDALNAAKSFLGINSPSRVFADTIGRGIPEGIAKGIADHSHLATRAVTAMAAALPTSVGTSVQGQFAAVGAGIPALAGAGGAGGGGAAITIDLRGAVVANQSAMDQLAATIGKRIATIVGPSAGLKFNGGAL